MISVLISLLQTLRGLAQSRAVLHLEVLALRHQLQAAANTPSASTPRDGGPLALGVAGARVDRVANGAGDRQAGDGDRVAPLRVPVGLDLQEPEADRSAGRASERPDVDSHDVTGQPVVGRASDSRRTVEDPSRATDRTALWSWLAMEHPHPVRVVLRVGEQRAFQSSRGRMLASVIARHRRLLLCRWSFWQGQARAGCQTAEEMSRVDETLAITLDLPQLERVARAPKKRPPQRPPWLRPCEIC
jgi:hypothetical protein